MADALEIAPWLQQDSAAPDQSNLAPWLQDQKKEEPPSTVKDIAKTAAPSALRGTLGALTMPGTLLDLVKKGAAYGYSKMDSDATPSSMFSAINKYMPPRFRQPPTYDKALSATEKVTGPLYEAQTPGGRAFQTGVEALPSMAMGGEGIIPTLLRSAGAGIGGELTRQGAEKVKPLLPESMQPFAGPVGQAVGTAVGGGVTPKLTTPFPLTPERRAVIDALERQAPGFPMSAGQQANSPGLMSLETRSPNMATMPEQQATAFTDRTMQSMGSGGAFNPTNLARGEDVGNELGNIRRANNITGGNFQDIITAINNQRRGLQRVVGRGNTDVIDELRNDVLSGAMNINGQRVYSMPGARYGYMRERIQNSIDAAPTSQEKMALAHVREALDNAFYASVPNATAQRVQQLENQYTNYNSLRNLPPNADRVVNETLSPSDVMHGAATHMGNSAVNADRGTLVPFARNAAKVMQDFPPPGEGGNVSKILGGIAGGVGGAGASLAGGGGGQAALSEGLLGSLVGYEHLPAIVDLLKNGIGRAAGSGLGQAYLKNQMSVPRRADPSAMLRLLMSPPEQALLPNQSK